MTHLEAHKVIRTRFIEQVKTPQSLTTQFDNEFEDKPDVATDPVELHCRFSIVDGTSFQTTVGRVRNGRTPGVAYAELFVPIGKGTKEIETMAAVIIAAFERVSVDGVVFKTPSLVRVGRVEEEYKINVEIPYHFDS